MAGAGSPLVLREFTVTESAQGPDAPLVQGKRI
jgi:hypothetical protein